MPSLLEMQAQMGPEEWRLCSDTAQVCANFLRCHPAVAEVRYPGLTCDPDYREASSTLRGGFGPLVRVSLAPDGPWLELDARAHSGRDAREAVLALDSQLRPF